MVGSSVKNFSPEWYGSITGLQISVGSEPTSWKLKKVVEISSASFVLKQSIISLLVLLGQFKTCACFLAKSNWFENGL